MHTTTEGSGLTAQLAELICSLDYRSLPPEVIKRAKDYIIDQFGIQLVGATLPWNKSVYAYVEESAAKGQSTVVYYGLRTNAEYAAFANGAFGNGIDMDDFHSKAMSRPGIVVVPATIAMGETTHASGKDALLGVALGTEVTVRIGLGIEPSSIAQRGFNPTCVQGAFGSAAVVSRLLHLNPQETLYGLGIAGAHCSGTTEYENSGGEIKRLYGALGAMGGIRAGLLAAKHVTAPVTILEGKRGILQIFGNEPKEKWTMITEGFGTRYHMLDTKVKVRDLPGSEEAMVEAIYSILRENPVTPEDIQEIVIGFNNYSLTHVGSIGPEPKDMVSASFSAHFNAALAVVKRSNDVWTYMEAMNRGFRDPEVISMARRVRLEWDEECEKAYPEQFLGKVTIKTKNGGTYSAKKHPKGSPQNPFAPNDARDKFVRLATPVLSSARVKEILGMVDELEHLKDIQQLTRLLVLGK